MSLLRTFSIVAAFALTPNLAHAFTYTICLKHLVHTVDSDVGEDFEVSPTGFSAWISRGSQVRVMKGVPRIRAEWAQHFHLSGLHSRRAEIPGRARGRTLDRDRMARRRLGGGGSYGYQDPDDECKFTGLGNHGMFSREDDFLSYQEAMGHLISAVAWNDPAMHSGVFKYYKDQAPYNFDTILLDTPGAWSFDWEGTFCGDPKLPGKSTEGDWLRLFWNYRNDVGWNFQPSLLDIATHVRTMFLAGGLVSSNAYAKFTDAVIAGYPWFQLQWETLAQDHGPADP